MRFFIWLLLILSTRLAAETTQYAANYEQLLSMLMSLGLVVMVIVLLAMAIKRLNPNMVTTDEFKVVRSINLGTKERLMIVEMDGKHHVLGVTSQSINYLYQLDEKLKDNPLPPMAQGMSQIFNRQIKK